MQVGLLIVTFLAGITLAMQVGCNRALGASLGNAASAIFTNFAVGFAAMALFVTVMQVALPTRAAVSSAPWWSWLGGIFGAFYVITATLVVARIGVVSLLAISIAGQLLASLVIDHYGLLGLAQQSITATKLAGSGLLMIGMWLIIR